MKHYLLSIQQPDGVLEPELLEPIMRDVRAVDEELKAAGVWVFGGGLTHADQATVARLQDDEVLTTDGPYVEGKEHVGGLTIIKAPDLDTAIAWGRKLARAVTIPVEVREFQGSADDHMD